MTVLITAIEPQKRKKDRLNIYINGQFGFGLSSKLAEGIAVGQSLTATEIEKLQTLEMIDRAKEATNNYLSYRPRSVQEVRRHLSKKEYSDQVIDEVIEDLSQADLLDDRTFVNYWIEQREAFRPRGRFALRQELYQKGINTEIIDAALAQVDEYDSAFRAGKKKAIQLAGTEEMEFRKKLGQFLKRRGFEYEIIAEVTKALRDSVIVE
jgi:regulatory protein